MRWERLFDDLEAMLEADARRDRDSEVADRTRRERATILLITRLAAAGDRPLQLRLVTGRDVRGQLSDLGHDWIVISLDHGDEALIPLSAVISIRDLPSRSESATTARRFSMGSALRALSRNRQTVSVTDRGGFVATGTLDQVGADFVDLAEHAKGDARREAQLIGRRTIPFASLVMVEASP